MELSPKLGSATAWVLNTMTRLHPARAGAQPDGSRNMKTSLTPIALYEFIVGAER